MITDSLLNKINRGREGKNHGLRIGLDKLESVIDGLTASTYYLLFSQTSGGKSTLMLFSFVYYPLKEHLEDGKFRASIFSLEMSADILYGKLLTLYLWDTYGIDISIKELLSRKKDYILSDDLYSKVLEGLKWLRKVEKVVKIYDNSCNASYLYKTIITELKERGKFEEVNGKKVYKPDDPDVVHLVAVDHMSLLRPSEGRSVKGEIDETSKYLVTLRNMCGISPLVVMQINREASSMDRRKANMNNLTLNDTKDSGNCGQDCEVALALFNPNKEELSNYHGWNIKELRDRFRSITVRKSRYGESEIEIGCFFWGRNGYFIEIPKGDEIYDYTRYRHINSLTNNKTTNCVKEDIDNEESNNNFTM